MCARKENMDSFLGFRISLYLKEGEGVADITWYGPFCVDRKAEYGGHT